MNRQIVKDLVVRSIQVMTRIEAKDGTTIFDPANKIFTGAFKNNVQVASGDGAISIKSGVVVITKATAAALTLAAPTAGADDGNVLWIDSTTAAAHTITLAGGLRGAGAGADVGTMTAAIGNGIGLYAYNGAWYPIPGTNTNVTFA